MSPRAAHQAHTREIVERFDDEIYRSGNLAAIDELVAEDFAHHAPMPTPQGREGFRQFIASFREAFPDATSTTEDTVIEGDKATLRYTMRATHQGEFAGVPATGRAVEVSGISIYRVADGKVTDEWAQPDMLGLMQQLGVISQS